MFAFVKGAGTHKKLTEIQPTHGANSKVQTRDKLGSDALSLCTVPALLHFLPVSYVTTRFSCFSRYPWGDEAFEKAKQENKPIFLSGELKCLPKMPLIVIFHSLKRKKMKLFKTSRKSFCLFLCVLCLISISK